MHQIQQEPAALDAVINVRTGEVFHEPDHLRVLASGNGPYRWYELSPGEFWSGTSFEDAERFRRAYPDLRPVSLRQLRASPFITYKFV